MKNKQTTIKKVEKIFVTLSIMAVFAVNNTDAQNPNQPAGNSGDEFTQNKGQLLGTDGNPADDVLFYGSGGGIGHYLMEDKISQVWKRVDNDIATPDSWYRMDMKFLNSKASVTVQGQERTKGYQNFFLGHIPNGVTNVPAYHKVKYENMWSNIDMEFSQAGGNIHARFKVKPGGNYNDIKFQFDGADKVDIMPDGKLRVENLLGVMEFAAPSATESDPLCPRDECLRIVDVIFVKTKLNDGRIQISLSVINNRTGKNIFISLVSNGCPGCQTQSHYYAQEVDWATYFGGDNTDDAHDTYLDDNNNLYFIGETKSENFPVEKGIVPQSSQQILAQPDVFVGKFDKDRGRVFVTYYGGQNDDFGRSLAVDNTGNIYFTGTTFSSDFPPCTSCPGYFLGSSADGDNDAFIVELNADGDEQKWSTYFGGSESYVYGHAIAIDGSGNIYLAGNLEHGTNNVFPILPLTGAYNQPELNSGDISQGFIARFNSQHESDWVTYLGGDGIDILWDIAIDGSNNLYVAGYTASAAQNNGCNPVSGKFPLCDPGGGAFVEAEHGWYDLFISRFNSSGTLTWSTLYPGTPVNPAYKPCRIITDEDNNVFVCGIMQGTDFPVYYTGNAYHQSINGTNDGFLLKFNNAVNLQWSTAFGGNDYEDIAGMTMWGDKLTIAGNSNSTTGLPLVKPLTDYYFQNPSGGQDAFIAMFNADLSIFWSTYYGSGACFESARAIHINADNHIVLVGQAFSDGFLVKDKPGNKDYYDENYNGGTSSFNSGDAFLVDLSPHVTIISRKIKDEDKLPAPEEVLTVSVYPNPNEGMLNLLIEAGTEQRIVLEVFNTLGQKIYKAHQTIETGTSKKELSFASFAKGIYQLKITAGDKTIQQKVVYH